jgi:cell division transport system permease protein
MRALSYSFDEAIRSLWRGRQSGILSTATIAVALFVLGGFLLATSNLERLAAEWSRAAEMSVYLDDGITDAERAAVEAMLKPSPTIASYTFVTKSDALARFKEMFTDLSATVDAIEGNPLPASFEVRLPASAEAQRGLEQLSDKLRAAPGVADVRYDRQWLDRLLAVVRAVRTAGFALGAMLTLAAALTVANVVRLGLYARSDEIEIMQLVGAPQAYIRGPFVMEGVLQGGFGALAALAALAITFLVLRGAYLTPLAAALNLSSVRFLTPGLCLLLLAGGMAVGCVGGLVAASGRADRVVTQS